MKLQLLIVILISVPTISNATLYILSILGGSEVSLGSFDSEVSVGDLTQKYPHMNTIDLQASTNTATLIELLRRMFGVGLFEMPPLDPFTSNNIRTLRIAAGPFISGKLFLNYLKLTGAKHFNVKTIELRMKTGRVDFQVVIPKLNFSVDFETDLYMGGFIPIFLKEQLKVQIHGLQLTGAFQFQVIIGKEFAPKVNYQIFGATVYSRVNDVKVSLLRGVNLRNRFLQRFFSGKDNLVLSQWVSSIGDKISKYAVNNFISNANIFFRGLSVDQVNAYLTPELQSEEI